MIQENQKGTSPEIFPKPKPVVKRTGDKAISGKQLLAKKYTEVDLGEYTDVIGEIEGKCLMVVYGPSASGKSTWVLKLVNYLASKYGKVIYNSHEERHNKTLQTRVAETLAHNLSDKLYFAPAWPIDLLKKKILSNKYRVVVIDSAQYMGLTYDQLIDLREVFKKRNIIYIVVSFGTALGKTDGVNDILHASDVKVHINQGKLTVQSRYLSTVYKEQLFNPKKNDHELFESEQK